MANSFPHDYITEKHVKRPFDRINDTITGLAKAWTLRLILLLAFQSRDWSRIEKTEVVEDGGFDHRVVFDGSSVK